MRLFSIDLALLHPPSVYDFRKNPMMFGPIADVIPSTPVFEMYPMGLTTLASVLENEGFNVVIVNVAYRMLTDPKYDVEGEIARLRPAVFGIDLHWLPHAHGALELAKIVKAHHRETPVLLGGFSASYYHEELIRSPWVDLVMRGDSTEEPVLRLLRALRFGAPLADVPNLTWKKPDGAVVVNPLTHVPENIDHLPVPNYRYTMRSVFKYRSLANVIPYVDWLDYPITALLTSRGRAQRLAALTSTVEEMSVRTPGAKAELKWPIRRRFAASFRLAWIAVELFLTELRLLLFKRTRLFLEHRGSALRRRLRLLGRARPRRPRSSTGREG